MGHAEAPCCYFSYGAEYEAAKATHPEGQTSGAGTFLLEDGNVIARISAAVDKGLTMTDLANGTAPLFVWDWENYPDGRRYHRVTRIIGDERLSIAVTVQCDGRSEFVLSNQSAPVDRGDQAEYDRPQFGRKFVNAEVFDKIKSQLKAFLMEAAI